MYYSQKVTSLTNIFFYYVALDLQPGAAGFQMGTPSVIELVSLIASLNVSDTFKKHIIAFIAI